MFTRIFIGAALMMGPVSIPGQTNALLPRPLQIAVENYPPYEYLENGVIKGINVDVIEVILKKLEIPYEIKFYPFSRGWLMLKRGASDAAPSISYGREREPFLYYTDEQRAFKTSGVPPPDYLWIGQYVFFINRKYEKSLRFESYDQVLMDGYRIGMVREYNYHPDFTERTFKSKMYASVEDGFLGLIRGEIDLFPVDRTVAEYIIAQNGWSDQISYLPKSLFEKPYLMVFSKKSDYPDLENVMRQFSAELRAMRAAGRVDNIRRQYIPEENTAAPLPRPLLFVCEEWAPFAFMDGNTLKGIDVEITDHIMKTLGISYEIRLYPWSRAWLMASNGKADAVLSVSYKPERKNLLLYTEDQKKFETTGEIPENYLWISEYVFFVKKKFADTFIFESYDQLREAGYRIGRNRDYTYDQTFSEACLPATEFPNTSAGLEAIVSEKIDLYPMDKTVGLATLKTMGLQDSITYLPKPLFSKPYLAPFVKGSDYPAIESVMEHFYCELLNMRKRGEIDKIREAYLDGTDQLRH